MSTLGSVIGRGLLASRSAAASAGRLYFATDGVGTMYRDNGSSWDSVETSPSAAGIATDTFWGAAGDLAVATGNDAASRLAIGSLDQVLKSDGTTAAWAHGFYRHASLGSNSAVSSSSFANAGLSFPVVVGSYFAEYFLHLDTNATTVGIKIGLNATDAGTTFIIGGFIPSSAPALNSQFAAAVIFAKDTEIFTMTTGPGGTRTFAHIWAKINVASNPDTIQLRHASETATLTTIYSGSLVRYARLT